MTKQSRIALVLVAAAMAGTASAQIIRPTRMLRPVAWTSASMGWLRQNVICDPHNNACWNFDRDGATQYRAAVDLPGGVGTSYGFMIAQTNMPLIWATQNPGPTSCATCQASSTISQFMGVVHLSVGGNQIQQIIELSGGVTSFSKFKDASGATLGDGKTIVDPSFSVGYGLGVGVLPRLQLEIIIQEYGWVKHKRGGGTIGASGQQQVFRVGGRLALGSL